METFTITPNLKRKRVFSAVLGLLGLLVTADIVYGFMIGNIPDDWFLYLPIGVWVMVLELGRTFGYYELNYSIINLDKSKLSVSGYMGGNIDLDKLSWMRLKNNRIEFKFKATGYKSYFRIPWNFRIKSRLMPLKKALHERCIQQKIEFESEL